MDEDPFLRLVAKPGKTLYKAHEHAISKDNFSQHVLLNIH
jgi:hypothetical protein